MIKKLYMTILVFLLLISSANALFYTDFRNPKVICNENELKLVAIHNGRVIGTDGILITAEDELGNKFEVKGNWFIKGEKVKYIKGDDPSEFTETVFNASTKFPKNENYKIFFTYKRTPEDFYPTTLQLTANCPGRLCTTNLQCAETESCQEGQCTNLRCNVCQKPYLNACIPKCDDNNICTKNVCREGTCSYEEVDNCCETSVDCKDGSTCTTDICSGNQCINAPVQCTETDVCVSGSCKEGQGCIYETNLTCLNKENRRYILKLGEPEIIEKETLPTNIWSAIATFLSNFFK